MLERTIFFFKSQLNDVKRIAFLTNLLVHCQYEIEKEKSQSNLSLPVLKRFHYNLWTEIKRSTNLTIANNESKLYFIFGGIFMADVYIGYKIIKVYTN